MNDDASEYSPVAIENAIRNCASRIANSVSVCNERYVVYQKAQREYDRAYAQAFLASTGAEYSRRYQAELKTVDERDERDTADAAYRYADRLAKALQDELRAWQSVGASVRMTYSVAGTGVV